MSVHSSSSSPDKEKLLGKIQEEAFSLLLECNIGDLFKYTRVFVMRLIMK
jgi:hypothetical protein